MNPGTGCGPGASCAPQSKEGSRPLFLQAFMPEARDRRRVVLSVTAFRVRDPSFQATRVLPSHSKASK